MADAEREILLNEEADSMGDTPMSRQSQDDLLDRRETKYWIGFLAIFLVNVLFQLGYSAWLTHSIMYNKSKISPFYYVKIDLFIPIAFFTHNLIGTLLLSNGLWGRFRGQSLKIYVAAFEVMILPSAFYSVMFILFVFGFNRMKEAIQKILIERDVHVQVEIAMVYIMVLCVAADVYHVLASVVVSRYCKIRRQRDWYF